MMEVDQSPLRRMKRRSSILPGTSNSRNKTSSGQPDHLAKYIEAVEEEKKKWENYKMELKAEYSKIKSGSPRMQEQSQDSEYFMAYLEEDEKNFLYEVESLRRDCKENLAEINSLKKGYSLIVPELNNQRKHLRQLIERKKALCKKVQMDMVSDNC